jgi:hypothetical protein
MRLLLGARLCDCDRALPYPETSRLWGILTAGNQRPFVAEELNR